MLEILNNIFKAIPAVFAFFNIGIKHQMKDLKEDLDDPYFTNHRERAHTQEKRERLRFKKNFGFDLNASDRMKLLKAVEKTQLSYSFLRASKRYLSFDNSNLTVKLPKISSKVADRCFITLTFYVFIIFPSSVLLKLFKEQEFWLLYGSQMLMYLFLSFNLIAIVSAHKIHQTLNNTLPS